MSFEITLYTDGSAKGNPGRGGYGAILMSGQHKKELSDGFRLTTNNRMELLAVIVGLEALKFDNCKVTVYSDSKYVVDAVEKKWLDSWIRIRFKQKKNKDLWLRYVNVAKKHEIKFVWIKGHNGHPFNERCDFLAVSASDAPELKEDSGYLEALKIENQIGN